MIQGYFDKIKTIFDQYALTRFVLESNVNFETRPGGQGYLCGKTTFTDGSFLNFSEYLDQTEERVDKLMYTYHHQDARKQLVFRYDNAHHSTGLRYPEHKHTPEQIIEASAPTLDDVLAEIVTIKGWA